MEEKPRSALKGGRDGRTVTPQRSARWFPALLAVLAAAQLLDPYRGWMLLLAGLGSVWILAWIWARQLCAGLDFQRQIRFGWAQVGDRLEERFTLLNRSVLPAQWVELRDRSTLPEYRANQVRSVAGNETVRWTAQALCTRRGKFSIGPAHLLTSDPFGLYEVKIEVADTTQILVTPPVVPLPRIQVASGGRTGEGIPRRDAADPTASAGGVRQYLPGDSLRWVHWPTSARMSELFVRLLDGTPAGDWWILLDLCQWDQVGWGWESTVEHGVILAASLAAIGLESDRSVGLLVNARQPVWVNPARNVEQRWVVLRELALTQPGLEGLDQWMRKSSPGFRRQSSLIVITPAVAGDWLKELFLLRWRGIVPTILLLDPESYGATRRVSGLAAQLRELGFSYHVFSRELFEGQEARPGKMGHWEWRISPTGRAVPIHKPQDTLWKSLG